MKKVFLFFDTLFCLGGWIQSVCYSLRRLRLPWQVKNTSAGKIYNLDQTDFGGNLLSSIRIPNGLKVVLYDAPEPGQGAKIRMTSDNRCFDSDWNERAQ